MYGVGTARSQARMTGLASGLDTEALVKGMTVAIDNKITKQTQLRQSTQWKMDTYRSISSKLIEFSNKYLTYTSKSNMLTSNFYSAATTSVQGSNAGAISVSGKATSSSLSITNIISTASTASFTSQKAVSNTKIETGDIDFSAGGKEISTLAGQTINFSYGAQKFDVKFDEDFAGRNVFDVAAVINSALAGIDADDGGKLSDRIQVGSGPVGQLEFSFTDGTDENVLKIIGGSGQSLSALGLDAGDTMSNAGTDNTITGKPLTVDDLYTYVKASDAAGKKLTLNYNGITRDVIIGDIADTTDRNAFVNAIQDGINKAFGNNRIKAAMEGDKLTFEAVNASGMTDSTATLTLVGGDGGLFGGENGILNATEGTTNRLHSYEALNKINFSTALTPNSTGMFEISVNGNKFSFSGNQSLDTVISTINKSDAGVKIEYLSTTNRFTVTATDSGREGSVDIQDLSGNLAASLFGEQGTGAGQYSINAGRDAEIEVSYDGGITTSTLTRSTNTFNVDGLDVTLKQGVAFKPGEAITFESKSNTDEIYKGIMEMVTAYNEITELVNKELSTKPDRKYYPLTDEMKEDMTEKEIEKWESTAQTGTLYGDPTLRTLASDLRFTFSFGVSGLGMMSEFGISTGTSYRDNGKITVDEEKLRQAIETRPEDVVKLFTNQAPAGADGTMESGIMYRIKSVVEKHAATTGASKGSLINIAGIKDSYYEKESRLFKQLEDIDELLERLKVQKADQEERYYRQFTTLEKYISQMNSQSSWLTQQ